MSKPAYTPPTIIAIRHQLGAKASTPLTAPALKVRTHIDGVALADLTDQFGSPLFVYSERKLAELHDRAAAAFGKAWPKVTFAWSYKTCYLKAVCAFFHARGSKAEVVSEMEYDKARRLGVAGPDILFNGPWKPLPALRRALADGARIHIDNFEEIGDIETAARELGVRPKVAIRLNMDAGIYPVWSKFGFNLENGQALAAVRRLHAGGAITLDGLHTHIGTFVLDPSAYGRAVAKLAAFATLCESVTGTRIGTLDLGGGFPSCSSLKGVYQPPEVAVPPIEAYAEAIGAALHAAYPNPADGPAVMLETGRHLVDEAGYLVTTVTSSKVAMDTRRSYLVDAGVHLLYTSTWYNFTIEADRPSAGLPEPSCLNGSLCMNIDVVGDGLLLPRLERGTRLVFSPVGAYNLTQSMPFIHCRPAAVLIRADGRVDLMRRAETIDDIEGGESLPADLRLGRTA